MMEEEIKEKDDYDDEDKVEQRKLRMRNNKHGDGVSWLRGVMLGKGSFGCVYLATLKKPRSKFSCFPSVMAIKSAEVEVSASVQKEKEVLCNIGRCDYVIRCFGEEITSGDNGQMVYNLLLEYGDGGTLADVIRRFGRRGGGGLPESDVKRFTKDILRGMYHIHSKGYVHCDLKPDNVLMIGNGRSTSEFRAKIGDLGLAKRAMQNNNNKKRKLDPYFRGTPMYLSPEAVADSIQEAPSDIWALGCIVIEMLTGKPAWDGIQDLEANDLLERIADGREMPKIPNEISIEAKNFLKGCLVRKPMYRLTAEMLLNHPFLEGVVDVQEAEEVEDVSDVDEDCSLMLLSEADDELSSTYSENDSLVWEEELVLYWSEEEEEETNGKEVIGLAKEGPLNIQECVDTASSISNSEFNHAMSTPVPPNTRHQYPIAFTIPAGV